MEGDRRLMTLILESLYLLAREKYRPMKEETCEHDIRGQSWIRNLIMQPPSPSLTPGKNQQKILEVTKRIIELLTGEVPVRCQDVAVYLSMEEREYLDQHCDRYKAAMMGDHMTFSYLDTKKEKSHLNEMLWALTLEIIYLLTGETLADIKTGGLVTLMVPPHHLLKPERNNKDILQITNKITELLTGEVAIRCQDVAVYLSMEEREYLEEQCDRYKTAMMENQVLDLNTDEVMVDGADSISIKLEPLPCAEHLPHCDITAPHATSPLHNMGDSSKSEEHLPHCDITTHYPVSPLIKTEKSFKSEECLSHGDIFTPNHQPPSTASSIKEEQRSWMIKHLPCSDMSSHHATSPLTCKDEPFMSEEHLPHHDIFIPGHHPSTLSQMKEEHQPCSPEHLQRPDVLYPKGSPQAVPNMEASSSWESFRPPPLQQGQSNRRPFVCGTCKRRYGWVSNLEMHARLHPGNNYYICWHCSDTFTETSQLAAHVNLHAEQY